jgi:hypothetical protein
LSQYLPYYLILGSGFIFVSKAQISTLAGGEAVNLEHDVLHQVQVGPEVGALVAFWVRRYRRFGRFSRFSR